MIKLLGLSYYELQQLFSCHHVIFIYELTIKLINLAIFIYKIRLDSSIGRQRMKISCVSSSIQPRATKTPTEMLGFLFIKFQNPSLN